MKPVDALMYALVKRFAQDFVPESLRADFDSGVDQARQTLAGDPRLADWVDRKTARIDTWQGVLEPAPGDRELWPAISAALFSGHNLDLCHVGEKGEMRHEVRPLAVVKRDEVVYLVLRFAGYHDTRLLPLHRIVSARPVDSATPPDGQPFDLDAFIATGLPFVLAGERQFDLHLLLAESAHRTVAGRPLRNTASLSAPVDGWFELKAEGVANTMELRWWLLGFGDKVRIVEPAWLARELHSLHFDPLTGLLARRACQEHLERMIAAAQRTGKPLAVAMVDIDHFKAVNDQLGHSAGDRALHEVAQRLRAECRSMDVVGRWGGEEFLILLPETALAEAALLAERLRLAVASTPCRVDDQGASRELSVSVGVTSARALMTATPDRVDRLAVLLAQADHALYVAKNKGRNCVELFAA